WIPATAQLLGSALLFNFCATFPRKLIREKWIWAVLWLPPLLIAGAFGRFAYHVVYDPSHAMGLISDWMSATLLLYEIAYFVGGIGAMAVNYHRLSDVNER